VTVEANYLEYVETTKNATVTAKLFLNCHFHYKNVTAKLCLYCSVEYKNAVHGAVYIRTTQHLGNDSHMCVCDKDWSCCTCVAGSELCWMLPSSGLLCDVFLIPHFSVSGVMSLNICHVARMLNR
jgi:hypothetical protein